MGSLKDYMYKRAAMSNGPGPKPAAKPVAKPAYTPQDSINFERQGKNFDANKISDYHKMCIKEYMNNNTFKNHTFQTNKKIITDLNYNSI